MTKFWKGRSTFVTGCTGLLGSHLAEALLSSEAELVGLVRDQVPRSRLNSLPEVRERMNIVHGDIVDFDLLERVLNEYEVDTVFHLAAQTIVGTANRNPRSTFDANIRGTWNLLEACRRVPTVTRIVVASSDKAYGIQEELPYLETAPLQGTHPYDVSKSCADLISTSYNLSYGLPVSITRCGNFFGGGDLNFNRLIPGTIRSVLDGERPIIRSDGTHVRDYIYVKDGATAYMLLAEKMDDPRAVGEAFNFSNEVQLDVKTLVEKILEMMGRDDLAPKILSEVRNEIPHQYLSAAKAREILGWKPVFGIDDALRETIDWYQELHSEGLL